MPYRNAFGKARAIAAHASGGTVNTYAVIEVHSCRLVLVAPSGAVSSMLIPRLEGAGVSVQAFVSRGCVDRRGIIDDSK